MTDCCPPGRGCNAEESEPCLLAWARLHPEIPECRRMVCSWLAFDAAHGWAWSAEQRARLARAYASARRVAQTRIGPDGADLASAA
jgi:hypothetical protein